MTTTHNTLIDRSFVNRFYVAAFCSSFCEFLTYPLDFLTTRMQLQNELGKAIVATSTSPLSATAAETLTHKTIIRKEQLSFVKMALHVVKTEGFSSLYAGAGIAITRQVFNAGVSVGLYSDVRSFLFSEGETPSNCALWKRALAGAITGASAQLLSNPTDVIRVRLQADGRMKLAGLQKRYTGAVDAAIKIATHEGFIGFYAGLSTSIVRAALINAAGISAYDHVKQAVKLADPKHETRWRGIGPQLAGSIVCGIVGALVAAPINTVRTRLMNSPTLYRHSISFCAVETVKQEGVLSLYKGFVPTLHRQILFNTVFWIVFEGIQRELGQERL
jgi:hypothetical protein